MDEYDPALETAEPNVILRGGPLDGEQLYIGNRVPISIHADGQRAIYRPTAELDSEYQMLAMWVFDHNETA